MFDADAAAGPVRAALEAYPDDPSGLGNDQAGAGFAQLQRISEVVEAKRLRWLADQDRRASFRKDGYLSSAARLAHRFQVATGSAKKQVQVAQALEQTPHVIESFFGDVCDDAPSGSSFTKALRLVPPCVADAAFRCQRASRSPGKQRRG